MRASAGLRANGAMLLAGSIGALIGSALGLPMPLITGPAIAVTCAAFAGLPVAADQRLRDWAFLISGVGIGAGVTPAALEAVRTWPIAFIALPLLLIAMMKSGQWALQRACGMERPAALLAVVPGHLSFVFALSESLGLGAGQIVLVQMVRLLLLSLLVPLGAAFAGLPTSGPLAEGGPMIWWVWSGLILASWAITPLLARLHVPAPMMISGLFLSSILHATGIIEGTLPQWLDMPTRIIIGALLGTRFAGITWRELRPVLGAGALGTAISAALAAGAAAVVAPLIGMDFLHVLVAFAPGGLQTMVIIGVTMGANPAFVAAAHVARLALLSALIPLLAHLAQRRA